MRELVRAHLTRGHTVVLSSSALTIQVGPVARFLGILNTLTNVFETDDDGILTGGVVKPILWGPGKAAAVQKFAAEHGIDLKDSYFYADGDEDVALMYLVGQSAPDEPGRQDGRGGAAPRLADPAVHQPQRRGDHRTTSDACRCGVDRSGRVGRGGLGPADP